MQHTDDTDGNLTATAGYAALRRTEAHRGFAAAREVLLRLREDLDAARAAFTWPRPAHFNWALEWFDVLADGNRQPALELGTADGGAVTVSYQELSARSDQVANWLTELGVGRGDRVLVVLDQRVALWETLLACLKTGAVVIPTYTSLTAAEAADRVARGRVDHLVVRSESTGLFDGAPVRTRIAVGPPVDGWRDYAESLGAAERFLPQAPTPASDIAFAYFTSGTTSAPKLVAHTHASYPIGHLSSLYWNGLLPGDRHVNVSEAGWAKHSWSSFFVPFTAGATLVLPAPGELDPARFPAALAARRVTTLCAPASYWTRLAPHLGTATPRLREATSAGEPLNTQVADAVEAAWGLPVRDGYGQTETTGLIGTTPGMRRVPGRLGRPLPGWEIRLEDGHVCVDLTAEPVGMMAGYDGDEVRTKEALGGAWYRTGDIGDADAAGYIRILGRNDDVFKSGGHRVSPYELEAVLRTHPAVRDAAVIPAPHPVLGLAAHAVVELVADGAAGPAELIAHVDARVTEALRVHGVTLTARLPRTASGKIRRSPLSAPETPTA
jgi:acetyl-CoA synthetase